MYKHGRTNLDAVEIAGLQCPTSCLRVLRPCLRVLRLKALTPSCRVSRVRGTAMCVAPRPVCAQAAPFLSDGQGVV